MDKQETCWDLSLKFLKIINESKVKGLIGLQALASAVSALIVESPYSEENCRKLFLAILDCMLVDYKKEE